MDAALRVDLELFSRGGLAVLDAIEAMGYNTLEHRPSIGTAARVRLLGSADRRTGAERRSRTSAPANGRK